MVARIEHHIAVEVNNLLHIPQGHVEQDRYVAGNALEIPNVGYGGSQLDETHAVTAHPALRHLHTTALADDAAVTHPFVLAAVALPVLGRAKDLLAEEPVHLGLQRAVVDGFGLGYLTHHLTVGQRALPPLHDPLRRRQGDLDVVEVVFGAEVAVGHRLAARGDRERNGRHGFARWRSDPRSISDQSSS